jgi:hypothetical protein
MAKRARRVSCARDSPISTSTNRVWSSHAKWNGPNVRRKWEGHMDEKSKTEEGNRRLTRIAAGEGVGRIEFGRSANPGIIGGESALTHGAGGASDGKGAGGTGEAGAGRWDRKNAQESTPHTGESETTNRTAERDWGPRFFMMVLKLILAPDTSIGGQMLGKDMGEFGAMRRQSVGNPVCNVGSREEECGRGPSPSPRVTHQLVSPSWRLRIRRRCGVLPEGDK